MSAQLLAFPEQNIGDIPRGLRWLADQIEGGQFKNSCNLVWALDLGDGQIEVGLLGRSPAPGAEAHFLFALAQRRLELL